MQNTRTKRPHWLIEKEGEGKGEQWLKVDNENASKLTSAHTHTHVHIHTHMYTHAHVHTHTHTRGAATPAHGGASTDLFEEDGAEAVCIDAVVVECSLARGIDCAAWR